MNSSVDGLRIIRITVESNACLLLLVLMDQQYLQGKVSMLATEIKAELSRHIYDLSLLFYMGNIFNSAILVLLYALPLHWKAKQTTRLFFVFAVLPIHLSASILLTGQSFSTFASV